MDLVHKAACEVAMRMRDLDRTRDERRTEEEIVCNLLIAAASPALAAISTRVDLGDGYALHGVPLSGTPTVDCAGLRSGWALYLTDAGLCMIAYGPDPGRYLMGYCSTREALGAGILTAEGLAETLAGLLDAHLHGQSEVRRREYAEILGRMRAASAALRGEK